MAATAAGYSDSVRLQRQWTAAEISNLGVGPWEGGWELAPGSDPRLTAELEGWLGSVISHWLAG